jgi:Ca2+-binding EF-hand superfamily protein
MPDFRVLLCFAALTLHALAGQEPSDAGAIVAESVTDIARNAAGALPPMPPVPAAGKTAAAGATILAEGETKTEATKEAKKGDPIYKDLPKVVENPKLKKEEEEEMHPGSSIETRNLWAFLGIISFLLFFTVLFEVVKEMVVEFVHASPNQPIVSAIFSELTVLGFLAFVAFLLGKFGLSHISLMVYGTEDLEEDKMKLAEMLEQIHMVIFIMMIIFIMQALGMLWFSSRCARVWGAAQARVLKKSDRKKLVTEFHDVKQNNMPTWFERNLLPFCGRAKRYLDLQGQVQFMLLRQEFRYDEKVYTADEENPEGTALDKDFAFSLYLKKIMGARLAEIVELPMLQWVFLEIMIAVILTTTVMTHGSWQYLLWLCQSIAWLQLVYCFLFRNKLNSVYHKLSNHNDGLALVNEDAEQVTVPVDGKDTGSGEGSGTGSGAGSAPTEDTPLQGKSKDNDTPRTKVRAGYPPEIRADMPRFLHEDLPPAGWCIPQCLKGGDYMETDPHSAQTKMYNLFWFGKNEVSFHRASIRFTFLVLAVHIAIFCKQIIPNYIIIAYDPLPAFLISVSGLTPSMLIYFKYIFEVIKLSVVCTSIESMRNRRMVNRVVRHQKEDRALAMLRMVVAMKDGMEPLSLEEKPTQEMIEQLDADGDNSFLVEKMEKIFNDIDQDKSGAICQDEMDLVFKRFGLEFDASQLQVVMKNMKLDPASEAKVVQRGEFIAWLVAQEKRSREMPAHEFAHKCFAFLDTEGDVGFDGKDHGGDNVLSISELQMGLQRIGQKDLTFDFNEVAAMVLELDSNDDNELDIEEFARWVELQDAENLSPEEVAAINDGWSS